MSETSGFGDRAFQAEATPESPGAVGTVASVPLGGKTRRAMRGNNQRFTPAGLQRRSSLLLRRGIMFTLVLATLAGLTATFAGVLGFDGLSVPDFAILGAFVVSALWNVIGFWNAVIGFVLLRLGRTGELLAAPHLKAAKALTPITSRTAIVMAVRNEAVDAVIARLRVMKDQLDATDHGDRFDFHILSDTDRADVAGEEETAIAGWKRSVATPRQIHYRRRTDNTGFKAGNIREFCLRAGAGYDFMLTLDADSLMSAEDIFRLVRIMQAYPRMGLVQSLVVGLPSDRFFTRVFQFGMRHGMRTYTTGSAWWQADCGPYWGHNALIRTKPFTDACELPVLPGKPPLGGHVLSHDQIEAAMLRRAGHECRVVPLEGASYEENPPTLPDFNNRDLRWCQGNMQYFRLLSMPGLVPTSWLQVLLAILMYFGSAGWMLFTLASAFLAHQLVLPDWMSQSATPVGVAPAVFPVGVAVSMFAVIMAMNLAPKITGLFDVLANGHLRRAYGGTWRVLGNFFVEFVFSVLLSPAVALSVTMFMVGLLFGKRVIWDGRQRAGYRVGWAAAFRMYWPHVLTGAMLTVAFWTANPVFALWGAPLLLSLLFTPVFAVVTSMDGLSAWATRRSICAIPEERVPSTVMTVLDAELAMPQSAPARTAWLVQPAGDVHQDIPRRELTR